MHTLMTHDTDLGIDVVEMIAVGTQLWSGGARAVVRGSAQSSSVHTPVAVLSFTVGS